jgi:hypothetical protein
MIFIIVVSGLFASIASETRINWYNNPVWNDGKDRRRHSKAEKTWKAGGAWADCKNWTTGHVWDLNSVWNASNEGVTYHLLSNMNDWNTLPSRFNVSHHEISKCPTWTSYKQSFAKTYQGDHTTELQRQVFFHIEIIQFFIQKRPHEPNICFLLFLTGIRYLYKI